MTVFLKSDRDGMREMTGSELSKTDRDQVKVPIRVLVWRVSGILDPLKNPVSSPSSTDDFCSGFHMSVLLQFHGMPPCTMLSVSETFTTELSEAQFPISTLGQPKSLHGLFPGVLIFESQVSLQLLFSRTG